MGVQQFEPESERPKLVQQLDAGFGKPKPVGAIKEAEGAEVVEVVTVYRVPRWVWGYTATLAVFAWWCTQ